MEMFSRMEESVPDWGRAAGTGPDDFLTPGRGSRAVSWTYSTLSPLHNYNLQPHVFGIIPKYRNRHDRRDV